MAVRLSRITRELHSRIRQFFEEPLGADATPLEIREAVLDQIERSAQPAGRGRRVFPYNRVDVVVAGCRSDRPALEAVLGGIGEKVEERLGELSCERPDHIEVSVSFPENVPPNWTPGQLFSIGYSLNEEPRRPAMAVTREGQPQPSLRVLVLKGAATEGNYTFTQATVSIGRTAEPSDQLGRVRRNRIAFLDAVDGVTETVGRAHARITFDPDTASYCVFDEGSSNGTLILRDGNVIPVPSQDPRGVRVESGDEIQLGRAVIQVSFETTPVATSWRGLSTS